MDVLPVRTFPGAPPPIVALHGFTQHGEMFSELANQLGVAVVAPDLPGHGRAARLDTTFAGVIDSVAAVVDGGILAGYSQGGRIALGVALEHPDAVSRLILISAGLGLRDESDRRERVAGDEALAQTLERDGLEVFLDWWMRRPLFAGLRARGPGWAERDLHSRLENTAAGVAAALRGFGQGAQPWFGDRLGELAMPVLYLAGSQDPTYTAIGERVAAQAPDARLVVVGDAGHALVGEAPAQVAREITDFLV